MDEPGASVASTRGVRYDRIDETIEAQKEQQGIAGWQAWRELLAENHPQRLARSNAGDY